MIEGMSINLSLYITTAEAAKLLGVNQSRIRQLIMEGRLAATKAGRDNFILKTELEAFAKLDRRPGNPTWQEKKKPKNRKKT